MIQSYYAVMWQQMRLFTPYVRSSELQARQKLPFVGLTRNWIAITVSYLTNPPLVYKCRINLLHDTGSNFTAYLTPLEPGGGIGWLPSRVVGQLHTGVTSPRSGDVMNARNMCSQSTPEWGFRKTRYCVATLSTIVSLVCV